MVWSHGLCPGAGVHKKVMRCQSSISCQSSEKRLKNSTFAREGVCVILLYWLQYTVVGMRNARLGVFSLPFQLAPGTAGQPESIPKGEPLCTLYSIKLCSSTSAESSNDWVVDSSSGTVLNFVGYVRCMYCCMYCMLCMCCMRWLRGTWCTAVLLSPHKPWCSSWPFDRL